MSDFEKAMRNGIKKVYPDAKILDCFFHFCKLLWTKAKKIGLRKEHFRAYTRIMICLLTIIIHIEAEKQATFLESLKSLFKDENKKYGEFLSYFEKNWLKKTYVQLPDENASNELFARTNNACETFHSALNATIPMKKPRASILIQALKTVEYENRQMLVTNSQGKQTNLGKHTDVVLPFQKLYSLTKPKIISHKYDLRSLVKENGFLDSLAKLGKDCEFYLYGSKRKDPEAEEEDNDDIIVEGFEVVKEKDPAQNNSNKGEDNATIFKGKGSFNKGMVAFQETDEDSEFRLGSVVKKQRLN